MSHITRREAMKAALKTGMYAAPVILSATVPPAAAAQVSGPTADVSVTVAVVGSSTLHNGGTITFLVTLLNKGPSAANLMALGDAVRLTPDLGAAGPQISFVSATPSLGTYTPPPPIAGQNPGGVYTGVHSPGFWSVSTLAAGQSATLTLVLTASGITAPATGTYSTGFLFVQPPVTDPNQGNNFGSAAFTIAP